MEYRDLGRSGLKVSRIAIGGASFGEILDERQSSDIIHAGWDVGINTVYIADDYSSGAAEEIIGKICHERRDDLVIMTKVGYRVGNLSLAEYLGTSDTAILDHDRLWRKGIAPTSRGLSCKHLMHAVENSLRRLQTDYIDIYMTHLWDPDTPIEETLATFDFLVKQGKIRYIGCNQTSAWLMYKALWASDVRGYHRFESTQFRYSLLDRIHEHGLLPAAKEEEMGIFIFNSLGGGLLSGIDNFSEKPSQPLPDRGFAGRYTDLYWTPRNLVIAKQVGNLAREFGRPPSELAQGWVLSRPGVTSILAGPMSPDQVRTQANIIANPLSPAELLALDANGLGASVA